MSRSRAIEVAAYKKVDAPCKECKRRAVGCHSACVDYAGYKKQLKGAIYDMRSSAGKDILTDNYITDNRKRMKRSLKNE